MTAIKHIGLRLPEDIHARIKAAAERDHRSIHSWLLQAIESEVLEDERDAKARAELIEHGWSVDSTGRWWRSPDPADRRRYDIEEAWEAQEAWEDEHSEDERFEASARRWVEKKPSAAEVARVAREHAQLEAEKLQLEETARETGQPMPW